MALRRLAIVFLGVALVVPRAASGQSPTYGLGSPLRPDALKAIDIDVSPDGRGLPPGSGSAAEGAPLYASQCAMCHGAKGEGFPHDALVGGQGSLATARPLKTVGSYWPYATTLWDYVNRAMPFGRPGTLPPDAVYAVTAYILHLNGIVGERDVLSETTLAKVAMPNRDGFVREKK